MTASPPSRPPLDHAGGLRRTKLQPHELTTAITGVNDIFVLAHFGVPRVDAAQWALTIDGLVGRARRFTLSEIKGRPKVVVESVHQCCGSPLEPRVPTRRVSNVRWGGADLTALLGDLDVADDARFLAIARTLAHASPELRCDVVDGSGHDPTLEAPRALADVIARTLGQRSG